MGVRSPTMFVMRGVNPATADSTRGVEMLPLVVRTPVTLPPCTSMPSTSVCWWISTPR